MRRRGARWRAVLFGALFVMGCTPSARETRGVEEAPPALIGHRLHVQEGVHCLRCHEQMDDDQGRIHLPSNPVCVGCHEAAHKDDAHRDKPDCLGCHQESEAPLVLRQLKEDLVFDHATHLPRVKQDCVRCHRGAIYNETKRLGAVPTMADCGQCHQAWIDDLQCEACHRSLEAYPLLPVAEQAHRGDFLRRHSAEARQNISRCGQCHSEASCADCHDARAPFAAAVAFPDRTDRSFIHPPNFLVRHGWEARLDGPLCLGCHTERTCNACHTAAGRGPGGRSPHGLGWASTTPGTGANLHGVEARRDILSCAACHGGAGGALCVMCHAPGRAGGSPHILGRTTRGSKLSERPCILCH